MSVQQSCEILQIAPDRLSISAIQEAFKTRQSDLQQRLASIDLVFKANESIADSLDKQAKRQELHAELDVIWAAAMHLESALHLDQPGCLCTPIGMSMLDPNIASPKQALLLHLLKIIRDQKLCWANKTIYQRHASVKPNSFDIVQVGDLENWIWRMCDKELHYAFWSLLVEQGTSSVIKILQHQPEFPQYWRQPDAWAYKDSVFLANEMRWVEGCAAQSIPDDHIDVGGDDLFWATVLGWPLRKVQKFYFPTMIPCLEAIANPSLPKSKCTFSSSAPVKLVDCLLHAVESSFICDRVGPMDRYCRK